MHINGSCSDPVIFESKSERGLVYEAPTGGVDEEGSGSHLFDRVLVDKMVVVFIQSTMEGNTIGLE